MSLHAPFNFVPLPDKVFFPKWAGNISQDIPFEDGESGVIELEITAQTPIFVRNGEKRAAMESKEKVFEFSKAPDGTYFIPGTSIKGAIRSVLEILSYGKLDTHVFQNSSFGIRDLSQDSYRKRVSQAHCGWLYKEGEKYYIIDCGIPYRVSLKDIDAKFQTNFDYFVQHGDFRSKDEYNKTASNKYQMFAGKSLNVSFSQKATQKSSRDPRKMAQFGGHLKGTLVFTGQPGRRTIKNGKWTGKYYEFIFPEPDRINPTEVRTAVIEKFLTIYAESPDFYSDTSIKDNNGKFFLQYKDKLKNGDKIPVFFTIDGGQKVEAIGLSYMFRYPAKKSIHNAVSAEYLKTDWDLSDCIFGTTQDNNNALKSRVYIGHAIACGKPSPMPERKVVLSTPHPSYYPLYLSEGMSWDDQKAKIAGRKRYPTRFKPIDGTQGTGDMVTRFKPLPEYTKFKETITFHNLKRCEIGAILSAILFHGNKECFHNMGQGKPLGYGKVSIKITNMEDEIVKRYLDEFEKTMQSHDSNWLQSPALKELFAMAKGIPQGKEKSQEFAYMEMDTKGQNEFADGKRDGRKLNRFSQILHSPNNPTTSSSSHSTYNDLRNKYRR